MGSYKLLTIDGSFGEGGGQILRNAIALSLLDRKGIRITNIRANRKNPGLRPQHLSTVLAARQICDADVDGVKIGSREVVFIPGEVRGGEYEIDIGTAGSVTLLLQGILAPLLSAGESSVVRIIGGTDVPWSPPVDYMNNIMFPVLREMGANLGFELLRRGFYPKGGGKIEVRIEPSSLNAVEFVREEEETLEIQGIAFASNLRDQIPERMRGSAVAELRRTLGNDYEIEIQVKEDIGFTPGTGITLWAVGRSLGKKGSGNVIGRFVRMGASARGERGVRAEDVGKQAANKLVREIQGYGGLDIHAADQLPVFSPLIDPRDKGSKLYYTVRKITPHLRTVLWLFEKFGISTSTLFTDGCFHVMV